MIYLATQNNSTTEARLGSFPSVSPRLRYVRFSSETHRESRRGRTDSIGPGD